jgi:pyruvyltransferase
MLERIRYRARLELAAAAARPLDAHAPRARLLPVFWFPGNFGDALSPAVLRGMFKVRPVRAASSQGRKMLAIGSVLHHAQPGDVVFGTGSIREERHNGRGIRFLAVRGPQTRATIDGDVPEVYGDPAMLLPRFYTPNSVGRRFEVGVVPHYVDKDLMLNGDPRIAEVDVHTDDWRRVVDMIASCDHIVSSSLHGLIVAEAYGIPAVWVQPSGRIKGGRFKFDDYYASTGREVTPADWAKGLVFLSTSAPSPPEIDLEPLLRAWPH